jgi:hypothetical protein
MPIGHGRRDLLDPRLGLARRTGPAVLALIALLGLLVLASPASADGEDETQERYLLVQQALVTLAAVALLEAELLLRQEML